MLFCFQLLGSPVKVQCACNYFQISFFLRAATVRIWGYDNPILRIVSFFSGQALKDTLKRASFTQQYLLYSCQRAPQHPIPQFIYRFFFLWRFLRKRFLRL